MACKICKNIPNQKNLGSINAGRVYSKNNYPLGKYDSEIEYYLCNYCQFIYSPTWDNKDTHFWEKEIYNEDYIKYVDPDFSGKRSKDIAPVLKEIIHILAKKYKTNLSILDYGSGQSLLSKELKKLTPSIHVESYDPYAVNNTNSKTNYDLIIAIEVFEHAVDVHMLMQDIVDRTNNDSIIIFTTKLISSSRLNLEWDYIAPRNGHISIFSKQALKKLASIYNLYFINLIFFNFFSFKKLTALEKVFLFFKIIKFKLIFHISRLIYKNV